MIEQHLEALGRIRACLDWAIQQTCASWITKHEGRQLTEVNPNVLAGDIRQSTFFRYNDAYPPISSRVRRGANSGKAMTPPFGSTLAIATASFCLFPRTPRTHCSGKISRFHGLRTFSGKLT